MVIISSIVFTCNYIDKGTRINIIELEKNYSKVNLNSINIIITTYLLKIQSGLNELINNYQNFANQIIHFSKPQLIYMLIKLFMRNMSYIRINGIMAFGQKKRI